MLMYYMKLKDNEEIDIMLKLYISHIGNFGLFATFLYGWNNSWPGPFGYLTLACVIAFFALCFAVIVKERDERRKKMLQEGYNNDQINQIFAAEDKQTEEKYRRWEISALNGELKGLAGSVESNSRKGEDVSPYFARMHVVEERPRQLRA